MTEPKNHPPFKTPAPKRILLEIIGSVLYAFTILLISDNIKFSDVDLKGLLFGVFIFVFLSEGIFLFDSLISRKYSWHQHRTKRLFWLSAFSLLWLGVITTAGRFAFPYFIPEVANHFNQEQQSIGLLILFLFIFFYVIALIAANYNKSLNFFIIENERLRQEKLKMAYFALQDQLNPHFLFNNLSTLVAIIPEDQTKAVNFAENFTDVYRYVLNNARKTLVTLKDELNFIRSYLALHQERLGDGLNYFIDIPSEDYSKMLPPLSLQFLVENAIKHNIAFHDEPLTIYLSSTGETLTVENNYQPKTSTYSTNTGLKNLSSRYDFLDIGANIEVKQTGKQFTVIIPLILQSTIKSKQFIK